MRPRYAFLAVLLLAASAQAYDVNDPRYNPYAVPNPPVQPYQPSYQAPPPVDWRQYAPQPDTSQMTPAWQANRQRAINACNMIWGNRAAQDDCFRGIP